MPAALIATGKILNSNAFEALYAPYDQIEILFKMFPAFSALRYQMRLPANNPVSMFRR